MPARNPYHCIAGENGTAYVEVDREKSTGGEDDGN
jgi:hypothetical protein